MIRYGNVSDDYIVYDHSKQARLGIYYYETGAYPRKSSVIYDRANASITTLTLDEIDPSVYGKTRVFPRQRHNAGSRRRHKKDHA